MTGPEFPNYTEAQSTVDAVNALKTAVPWMGPHMQWRSNDGAFQYLASPIKLPGEPEVPENMELKDVPMYLWVDIMRAWDVLSISLSPDLNDEITITSYRIGAGHPMFVTELQVSTDELEDMSHLLELITTEAQTRDQLGLTEPDSRDYANLDNALFELNINQRRAYEDYVTKRLAMTPDEIRWEKMRKFRWLLGDEEVDKISGPRWWGISEGRLLHAVYASSPDEAAVILEEHHGHDLFPVFFVDPYPEDEQLEFQERFEGKDVVRLIPSSNIGWPDDPENMTDEQRDAFEQLK